MEREKVIKGLVHTNAEKLNKVVNEVVNKVVKSESLNEQP